MSLKQKLPLYICILFLSLIGFVNCAYGATNVFYSVGQNTTDHQTLGAGSTASISISGTAATFSVGQTATNMGVGDKITYSGGSCFISGKSSSTAWTCTNATGGTAPQVSNVQVTSVAHAFSSMNAALSGATPGAADASHLNNANLVTADVVLNIPCYYDTGADTTDVTINGITTDATRYIRIYTPHNTSTEANSSQRHNGTRSSTKYRLEAGVDWDFGALDSRADYLRIEGLQVKNAEFHGGAAIYITPAGNLTSDVRISDTIVYDSAGDNADGEDYGRGLQIGAGTVTVMNSIAMNNGGDGFYQGTSGSSDVHIYNSVSINNGRLHTGYGFVVGGYRILNCTNCYAGGNTADYFAKPDGTLTLTTSHAADTTGNTQTALSTSSGAYFTNVTSGTEDAHLASTSSALYNTGTDLGADSYWLHPDGERDIDGQGRPYSTWEVGADELSAVVYFSVGQTTNDLKTGSPTLTIDSSGNGTLSVAQTGNMGVGDYIEYGTAPYIKAYIAGKTSTTVWKVRTATGALPGVGTTQPVNSIKRAYTSLNSALAGADTLIGTGNLITQNIVLYFPCYYDTGPDTTPAVTTSDYTAGADNYIKIYTPYDTTNEVNFSQRHQGKWDDSKYKMEISNDSGIYIQYVPYTRVEGIQVKITASGNSTYGISAYDETATGTRISNNIIKAVLSGTAEYNTGIGANGSSGTNYIWNNIIYDYTNGTKQNTGIYSGYLDTANFVYNNTIVNCFNGINNNSPSGSNTITMKNNIVQDCTGTAYQMNKPDAASTRNITDGPLSDMIMGSTANTGNTDGIGTDANKLRDTGQNFLTTVKPGMIVRNTSDGTNTYVTTVDSDTQLTVADDYFDDSENYIIYNEYYGNVTFMDAANDDYRLSPSDTVAREKGADVSADANLPFSTDIAGHTRPTYAAWDVGADEGVLAVYYSVGQSTSTNLITAGSSPVTVSGYNITFGTAQTGNIGVGDKVTYGANSCYISGKTSTTVWNCQNATGGTAPQGAGTASAINRVFSSLNSSISGSTAPTLLNTNNLYTGNYVLNLPCYIDSGTQPDTTPVTVSGYTTAAPNYIKIYTPNNTSTEANQSQRHTGKWDDSRYRLIASVGWGGPIIIAEQYVRVDGLQIENTGVRDNVPTGISINASDSTSSNEQISNNIIKLTGTGTDNDNSGGIRQTSGLNFYAWNNIIYDSVNGIALSYYAMALTRAIYNNAIIDCSASGITMNDNSVTTSRLYNNLVQGTSSAGNYDSAVGYDISGNNISSDATSPNSGGTDCGGHSCRSIVINFVDAANNDFHLTNNNNSSALNAGVDLSADTYLPFSTDSDGQSRVAGKWDIGADENNNSVIEIKRGVNFGRGVNFK